MTGRRTGILLWLAFAFVVWNVVFDHGVTAGALEFTREQVVRRQRGEAVAFIEDAYTPRVQAAAVTASASATVILVVGAALVSRTQKSKQ